MSNFKKIFFLVILGSVPLSANWQDLYNHLYVQGYVSFNPGSSGGTPIFNSVFSGDNAMFSGRIPKITPLFAVIVGCGKVIPNVFSSGHELYVGLEVIRKFKLRSTEVMLRFGLPNSKYMFWVGPKLGYNSTSEVIFWGVRAGVDAAEFGTITFLDLGFLFK